MLQLEFWISELAAKTGVSVRTIRYYIEEGLLPQPETRGKYAVFNEAYLDRLELIRLLKDAYLPLKEIKNVLRPMSDREIVEFLHKFRRDPSLVLASLNAMRERNSERHGINEDAVEYIDRVLHKPGSTGAMRKMDFQMESPPIRSMMIEPQAAPSPRENWQRITLADGIELHVREPLSSSRRQQLTRLVELIKTWLSTEGGNKNDFKKRE